MNRDSYGYEVGRDDNTWLSPPSSISYTAGRSGLEVMGGGWMLILLTYVAAGYVGINRRLPAWAGSILPAVGVVFVILNGIAGIGNYGLGLGTLLHLVGAGLVGYVGFYIYAPLLMPQRFGHLRRGS